MTIFYLDPCQPIEAEWFFPLLKIGPVHIRFKGFQVVIFLFTQRTSDTLIGYLPILQMFPKTSLCIRYHWYPFE